MADICDHGSEQAEYLLQVAIERHQKRAALGQGDSAEHCMDCGDDIPALRREKVRGVQTCVDCQRLREVGR